MLNLDEFLNNLILLGQLRDHKAARLLRLSAEFVNEINKITVKISNDKQVEVKYNFYDQSVTETVSVNLIYEFLDNVLQRKEQIKIPLKNGTLIEPHEWPDQLKASLLKIQEEKNYDHYYLKHVKLTWDRFHLEYFNDIVVLKDREKKLLTNVLRLKDALQQSTTLA